MEGQFSPGASRRHHQQRIVAVSLALMLVASLMPPVFAADSPIVADFGPGKYVADLLSGGKLIDVGEVEVYNDQRKIYIDVLPVGYAIAEVQVYVGADPIPVNLKGQPAPGKFPYKTTYASPVPEHHLVLDLTQDLGVKWGRPYTALHVQNIAVHVSLMNLKTGAVEGAWAEGARFFVPKTPAVGAWFSYKLERPGRGHFIDSPVGGLGYRTRTFKSVTDDSGSFLYYPGETVELSLAGWPIGSALGKQKISPLDIFQTAEIDDIRVANMARLLQSLDADGKPSNRISIPGSVQDALKATAQEWADAENDGDFEGYDFTDTEMITFLIDGVHAKMAGVEGVTLVKVSKEEALANLAKTLESVNAKFEKNVSKTPDLFTTKSRIELAPFYIEARRSDGTTTTIEYHDEHGDLIGTRDEAQPIVMCYLDEHPDTGALDVWAAVSRDDGETWKRKNLSRSADRSSFTLANGQEFYGGCEKPSLHVKDNKILIVWTSKYAKSGKPRYSLETTHPYYVEDIWGVGGPQRSTDYTYVDKGFPEVGELPYNAVWTQRGVIDKATGDIVWYKPERLTSGRRNAMQLVEASAGNLAGFAIAWQEDPEGIRPGQGKGSGVGWSGAIASHGTDVWYSYIHMDDFDDIDYDWVSGGDPSHDWPDDEEMRGRPKALVPFALPVRVTDNETINTNNIKVEVWTDADVEASLCTTEQVGYPKGDPLDPTTWTPITEVDEETGEVREVGTHSYAYKTPGVIADWHETVNKKGVPKKVAITADGRLLDGDTASTRPALFLQGYTKPDGKKSAWVILAYEESKGLGGGMPQAHHDTDDPDHEDGDSVSDCDDAVSDSPCADCHGIMHDGRWDEEQCINCHADAHAYQVPDPYASDESTETPDPDEEKGGGRYKPDIGKNIVYHSFDMMSPDRVHGGKILNLQAVDPETLEPAWVLNEDGTEMLDWRGDRIPAYENARRPRFLVQGAEMAKRDNSGTKTEGTVMVMVYKQGEAGRGGPSDIFIRRWPIKKVSGVWQTGNPYAPARVAPGSLNVSAITPADHPDYPGGFWENPDQEDPDKGIKLVRWTQDATNLNDYSWEYAWDNAQAQRGYLRGELLVIGYTWTPNWRSARNGNDIYNLYVRRSFDGGKTFTTTPATDKYGVYEYGGQGAVWSEVFRNPRANESTTGVEPSVEVTVSIPAGGFEPARNISKFTNNRENVIEPRIVPPGPVVAGSAYPEDAEDLSNMWLTFGTGATHGMIHGNQESEDEEDHGKMPLDLMYTYSTDWGDTWVFEEKTVPIDSSGNHAGETVFRPFYLCKGESMQGEAQVKLSADASKAYVCWNDEGLFDPTVDDASKYEMDTYLRRIMPYVFEHNQAIAEAVAAPQLLE